MRKYFLDYPSFITGSNIFNGRECRCFACYPSDDGAQVPVLVNEESDLDFIHIVIRNGVFETFQDAKRPCNLLAKRLNLPLYLTNGNKQDKKKNAPDQLPEWKKVKCNKCKKNFMLLSLKYDDKGNEVRARLKDHKTLKEWQEHDCVKNAEVRFRFCVLGDIILEINYFGYFLPSRCSFDILWRNFSLILQRLIVLFDAFTSGCCCILVQLIQFLGAK